MKEHEVAYKAIRSSVIAHSVEEEREGKWFLQQHCFTVTSKKVFKWMSRKGRGKLVISTFYAPSLSDYTSQSLVFPGIPLGDSKGIAVDIFFTALQPLVLHS